MARTKRKANPLVPELTPAASTGKVYKAAGYVRLSVEDGGKPGADTLERQKALIGGYIAEQADMQLVGLFCDNGRSGTDFARPQFEKLMDLVRKGQIDCIVVKDLSRFGRNYKETGNYLERIFPFLGVRFIAINDNFDTLTAERTQDGYIVPLKNLINEVYSKDISRKSGSALETKQLKGEFIGAWAPYGYSKDPENKNHLIVNPDTAPIVRQIFAWRKERISVIQIGRRLNDAGIPSPSAYLYLTGAVKTEKYKDVLWHTQIIKSLLAHPVYLGHMVQGRKKQSFYEGKAQIYVPESEWKIVRHTHEAIIDQETFDTVQAIAQEQREAYRQRLGKFGALTESENILQGLIYCKHCGRPLVRYKSVSHGKKLWYTFICPTHTQDPQRCPFVSIREEELTAALISSIQAQIALAANMRERVTRKNTSPEFLKIRSAAQDRLETARRTLKRSQSLYDSLYQNYVEQLITEHDYVTLKARYKAETEEAERVIAALEQKEQQEKRLTPENSYLTSFQSFQGQETLSREMAHALLDRVSIDAQRHIEIRFRYRDEYEALLSYLEGRAAE